MFPDDPFEYHFLDDMFATLYEEEQQPHSIILQFTVIVILLGCLGLFALVLQSTEARTKEIGIRKVLGATISGIVAMLSSAYLRWILLANLLAWPIAWFAMNKWTMKSNKATVLGTEKSKT